MHVEEADLTHHGVGVDLAHVESPVTGPDVSDAEVPMLVVVAGEGEARVLGDDSVVDGENGLRLHEDPGHL